MVNQYKKCRRNILRSLMPTISSNLLSAENGTRFCCRQRKTWDSAVSSDYRSADDEW
jgi:hypothetical protein